MKKTEKESFDYLRKYKKYGNVIEDGDRIIVRVKQGIVYKYNNKILSCEALDGGKEVYFVFDDIIFSDGTYINGTNANLIFINCTFTQLAKITRANFIELQNNKYTFYGFENNCIELTADEISIRNNDFTNTSFAKNYDEPSVNVVLIGEKIDIKNSVICTEFDGYINILAQELSVEDSTINGPNIYVNADNISTGKSVMVASNEVKIDNRNCNFNCAIKSPVTVYNDIKLNSSNNKIIDIDEEKAKLLKLRMDLINALYNVEVNCIQQNSDILVEIRKKLRNRKVSKVLKK